ncbi:hypothetical protein K8O68_03565 [Salipaludibacillus sp. CUR1]|uniref:hypothetical protein n=1 Tax=Salipaludibacillus sp. CUR1 TaxID=2820003 RepID=UPI001E28B070|nr:hypothetical protein [Salipaludibacillus sp. CUR1]MCE7791502.1 hypothetical protein [Salipaludibacillus sp. CUR1]
MINEATLIILLVVLMMMNFFSVGYLFFVLIDKIQMSKIKTTFYITFQTVFTFILALAIYHFFLSRFTDPAHLDFPNLRDYSFYYVVGWNVFFAVLAILYIANAVIHHIYAKKKEAAF